LFKNQLKFNAKFNDILYSIKMLSTDSLRQDVDAVYQEIALQQCVPLAQVHETGFCLQFMLGITRALELNGNAGRVNQRWAFVRSVPVLHRYVSLGSGPDELFIDGTWQQFLESDQRSPDLPKSLVGTLDEVVLAATEAGLSAAIIEDLWTPSRPEVPTQR
jgi:hypothetical protein